jgi:hypothetical protein
MAFKQKITFRLNPLILTFNFFFFKSKSIKLVDQCFSNFFHSRSTLSLERVLTEYLIIKLITNKVTLI